jgi:phosphopantothenoylcysteine decarboxylase / phosphopantothenate---cysteine ligase
MLTGRKIIVGVTASIAAYKAALLVRELVKSGAEVRVVMTPSAAQFVTPLTLATLSRADVVSEMFPKDPGTGTWHIHLGMWADAMIIAPASANTIARLAHGFADNALTSLVLALRAPLVVAPAMDTDMYVHPATQANIETLRARGVAIVPPDEGELASGLTGPGRLPDTPVLLEAVATALAAKDLAGRRIVVSAGPTFERLDPVRYLGNFSSGKMGMALARAARRRGADVVLVAGPSAEATPPGVQRIDVTSADEMHDAVHAAFTGADAVIMAAAVADFRPAHVAAQKIKKDAGLPRRARARARMHDRHPRLARGGEGTPPRDRLRARNRERRCERAGEARLEAGRPHRAQHRGRTRQRLRCHDQPHHARRCR